MHNWRDFPRSVPGLLVLITIAAAPAPTLASRDSPSQLQLEQADPYRSGDYGRIRFQINGVTVNRAEPGQPGAADLNSPIFPGDTLITAYDQRVEVELAGGTILRVDRDSELTFLALPSPYADFRDNTILQLARGVVRINARVGGDEEFRIDTPAGSSYLLGDGDFRIEATDGTVPSTRVISRRGVAEVAGAGGSVLVRGGMRTLVVSGSIPDEPSAFNTFSTDAFDRWVSEREPRYRDDQFVDNGAYDSLPEEVRPHYGELSEAGEWIYTDEYGYVWSPDVTEDWQPYRDGYWHYGNRGYFWVSGEPWGWAPYRYGRWQYVSGPGWCWKPGSVFGGAWVAWSWGSINIGWAPLGYYGYPAYYGPVHYGYYSPGCWTFVGYHHFYHPRRHHHGHHDEYKGVHDVGDDLRGAAVRTRPPDVSPDELAGSTEMRQKAIDTARRNVDDQVSPVSGRKPGADSDSFRVAEDRVRAKPGFAGINPISSADAESTLGLGERLPRPSGMTSRTNSDNVAGANAAGEPGGKPRFTSYPRKFRSDPSTVSDPGLGKPRRSYNSYDRISPTYTPTPDSGARRYSDPARTETSSPRTNRSVEPSATAPKRKTSTSSRIRSLFGSAGRSKSPSPSAKPSAARPSSGASRTPTSSRSRSASPSKSSTSRSSSSRSSGSSRSGGKKGNKK